MLIVLEGPEAVGKSTQLKRIAEWFTASGIDFVTVREPGGTELGDAVRNILLTSPVTPTAAGEALLFMASRAQLVKEVIRPALAQGRTVIVDRFFLSTYAYQIHGRGLKEEEVRSANRLATEGLVPDLTLLLQLSSRESRSRLASRAGSPDRMERDSTEFHDRVAAAFTTFATPEWQRTHAECGPIVSIDASGSEVAVFEKLKRAILEAWPGSFPGQPA